MTDQWNMTQSEEELIFAILQALRAFIAKHPLVEQANAPKTPRSQGDS